MRDEQFTKPGTGSNILIPLKDTGFYYTVKPGDTLWGICKRYDVKVAEVAKINKLADPSLIEKDQLLFIPKKIADKSEHVSYRQSRTIKSERSFIWPVRGTIVEKFGVRNKGSLSKGIKIRARKSSPVKASKSGMVTFSGDVKGYGKVVIVDHSNGYQSVYAHNDEIFVKKNDSVKQNSVIAKVGSTGRVNQSCLHFEIRKNHKPLDPLKYLS